MHGYTALGPENDEKSLEANSPYTELEDQRKLRGGCLNRIYNTGTRWIWLLHILLFTLSFSILFLGVKKINGTRVSCLETISAWSPGFQAVEYESLIFRGSLYHKSKWKGEPRTELDEAWHQVGQVGAMSITEDEVRRLGKDPEYVVKWPESLGGGHVVSVEVFHHLHCLNFIRKASFGSHYASEPSFQESQIKIRRHLDHCIDLLRQAIMCTGDVGLMTYNWVDDNPIPYPDFDTRHRCRNFTKLLEWGQQNMVTGVMPDSLDFDHRMGIKILDDSL